MSHDEIMKMTEEELAIAAGKVLKPWEIPIHTVSNDIAAAWQLVEFLWDEFGFTCTIEKKPMNTEWSVMFAGVDEDSEGNLLAEPYFIATGETAPLAITRAFLLAMEGING